MTMAVCYSESASRTLFIRFTNFPLVLAKKATLFRSAILHNSKYAFFLSITIFPCLQSKHMDEIFRFWNVHSVERVQWLVCSIEYGYLCGHIWLCFIMHIFIKYKKVHQNVKMCTTKKPQPWQIAIFIKFGRLHSWGELWRKKIRKLHQCQSVLT